MPLQEITEQDWLSQWNSPASNQRNTQGNNQGNTQDNTKTSLGESGRALLFFTPFCGTCALGEKMLEVVQATGKSMDLAKININYAPRLRDEWRIESVPCLVVVRGDEVLRKEYAMRSVDHLYEILRVDPR